MLFILVMEPCRQNIVKIICQNLSHFGQLETHVSAGHAQKSTKKTLYSACMKLSESASRGIV